MAIKIRLKKVGRKKQPYYRMVVTDSRKPRDGEVIERLGFYDPIKGKFSMKVSSSEVVNWIKNGAQPTEIAKNLLKRYGFYKWYEEFKKNPQLEPMEAKEISIFNKPKKDRLKKNKGKEETKAETTPEVKEEVKAEPKTKAKPEVKSEEKPEVKEEVKAETKEEAKPEVKDEAPDTEKNETKETAPEEKAE